MSLRRTSEGHMMKMRQRSTATTARLSWILLLSLPTADAKADSSLLVVDAPPREALCCRRRRCCADHHHHTAQPNCWYQDYHDDEEEEEDAEIWLHPETAHLLPSEEDDWDLRKAPRLPKYIPEIIRPACVLEPMVMAISSDGEKEVDSWRFHQSAPPPPPLPQPESRWRSRRLRGGTSSSRKASTTTTTTTPGPGIFGKSTRMIVRHSDNEPNTEQQRFLFELDQRPSLVASALFLQNFGAGDYLWKQAGPKWLDKIASRFLSRRSRTAIATIVEIIQSFEDHGVVDLFAKHSQGNIFWSLLAYRGLQKTMEELQVDQLYHETASSANSLVVSPATSKRDAALVKELRHYAAYASAAYGWKLGFAMRGTSLLGNIRHPGRLLQKRKRQRLQQEQEQLMRGRRRRSHHREETAALEKNRSFAPHDHHLISDTSYFLKRTGRRNADLVAAEWGSETHRPGYVLVRDPAKKALVFAIRGTWSFHDVLTDLCCTSQHFHVTTGTSSEEQEEHAMSQSRSHRRRRSWFSFSSPSSTQQKVLMPTSSSTPTPRMSPRNKVAIHSAHHGMLEAAQGLLNATQDIVEQELRKRPDYKLVIVGHSMGGGVGALLGTLWSERFPVSVLVYGPPCIAPLGATPLIGVGKRAHAKPPIVSVVMEGDPFGFISLGHVAELSVALDRLCSDKRLRERLLQATLFRPRDNKKDFDDNTAVDHQKQASNNNSNRKSDSWWLLHTMRYLHANCTGEKLYPPGRLLLLKKNDDDKKKQRGSKPWSLWNVLPQYFAHFPVRPSRLDLGKHMPSLYEEALTELAM